MRFTLNSGDQQKTVDIPNASLAGGTATVTATVATIGTVAITVITAIVTLVSTVITYHFVTEPQYHLMTEKQNDVDQDLKKKTQLLEVQKFEFEKKLKEESQSLEKQKFQSELLQSTLQGKNSKQRAQTLRMLADMKLLNISPSLIDDFIKNPNTVPQLSPQSIGKPTAPSTSVSGKPTTSK
jgi:hypothetical protein